MPKDGASEPLFEQWKTGKGIYASNGVLISVFKRSRPEQPEPDLVIFGLPGFFKGYFPRYSESLARDKHHFTWAVLKVYTENTAGRVTLRSRDPRKWPEIEFRYFTEGNDTRQLDLADCERLSRRLSEKLDALEAEGRDPIDFGALDLPSAAMREVAARVGSVAPTPSHVLVVADEGSEQDIVARARARQRPQVRRARARPAIGEDRPGRARQQFVERVDLRVAEARMTDRDRGIGEPLGGAGDTDMLALRRRGFLTVGTVVDHHREALRLGFGDILDADLRRDAELGGQGTKIAHVADLLPPPAC